MGVLFVCHLQLSSLGWIEVGVSHVGNCGVNLVYDVVVGSSQGGGRDFEKNGRQLAAPEYWSMS